jgi:hypothetical protein
MVEALRESRFLAVLGPSGSGKSSVVRAGLLPQLRSGALPFSNTWYYLVFKPGAHPLEELAVSLAHAQKIHDVLGVLKSLENDERELHLRVRLVLRERPQEMRFCFIVDQFEETFTLCQEQTERERFVQLLRYAATIAGGQTVIILKQPKRVSYLTPAASFSVQMEPTWPWAVVKNLLTWALSAPVFEARCGCGTLLQAGPTIHFLSRIIILFQA